MLDGVSSVAKAGDDVGDAGLIAAAVLQSKFTESRQMHQELKVTVEDASNSSMKVPRM